MDNQVKALSQSQNESHDFLEERHSLSKRNSILTESLYREQARHEITRENLKRVSNELEKAQNTIQAIYYLTSELVHQQPDSEESKINFDFIIELIRENWQYLGLIAGYSGVVLHMDILPALFSTLNNAGFEYVYGQAPPIEWGVISNFREHKSTLHVKIAHGKVMPILIKSTADDKLRGVHFGFAVLGEDLTKAQLDMVKDRVRGLDKDGFKSIRWV